MPPIASSTVLRLAAEVVMASALDQAGDGVAGLAHLAAGLVPARLDRRGHAVREVLVEEHESEGLERLGADALPTVPVDCTVQLLQKVEPALSQVAGTDVALRLKVPAPSE